MLNKAMFVGPFITHLATKLSRFNPANPQTLIFVSPTEEFSLLVLENMQIIRRAVGRGWVFHVAEAALTEGSLESRALLSRLTDLEQIVTATYHTVQTMNRHMLQFFHS